MSDKITEMRSAVSRLGAITDDAVAESSREATMSELRDALKEAHRVLDRKQNEIDSLRRKIRWCILCAAEDGTVRAEKLEELITGEMQ